MNLAQGWHIFWGDLTRIRKNFWMHVREEGWKSVPPLLVQHMLSLPGVRSKDVRMREDETQRYQAWLKAQQPDATERKKQGEVVFSHKLSFLIPTYNTDPQLLRALADSFLQQTNGTWEACFYDGNSPKQETRDMLLEQARRDPRIRVTLGSENGGISDNTNKALQMAQGDYVALVDHDDLVCCDTVYQLLNAAEQGADFIYSDEDKCNDDGTLFFEPHLKPDFAPDSLRSGNYICHIMAMKKSLMESVGGLRAAYDGSQDHDLALRATEKAERIVHIPRVLYHWRMVSTSFSHQAIVRCMDSATRAVDDQLTRLGIEGKAEMYQLRPRISYNLDRSESVTLIVAAHDAGKMNRWLRKIAPKTDRPVDEVIVVADADKTFHYAGKPCRVIPANGNRYKAMNLAAKQAKGKYLIFLEQGVRPMHRQWIDEMQMYAQRQDVGCVGTALTGRHSIYYHCGYAVHESGVLSYLNGAYVYGKVYKLWDRIVRNVAAVTASAMMIDRKKFLDAGGFAPLSGDVAAISLGMTLHEAGLVNVYTPYAGMYAAMKQPYCADRIKGDEFDALMHLHPAWHDPYFSPALDRENGCMVLRND